MIIGTGFSAVTAKIEAPVFDKLYTNFDVVGLVNYSGVVNATNCTETLNGASLGITEVTTNGSTFADLHALNGFNTYSVACDDGASDSVRFTVEEDIPVGTMLLLFFIMLIAGAVLIVSKRNG